MGNLDLWKEVMQKSESKDFQQARSEWRFDYEFHMDEWGACACFHPIKIRCILVNGMNAKNMTVGTCCVNLFNEQFKKIAEKIKGKKLSLEIIRMAENDKIIREKDAQFLTDILGKRRLSEKQLRWKHDLERVIFERYFKKR